MEVRQPADGEIKACPAIQLRSRLETVHVGRHSLPMRRLRSAHRGAGRCYLQLSQDQPLSSASLSCP
jgi:hypothetical protein